MIDPALNTAALAAVERVVNQALAHATNKKADLAALDDCVFALHCTAPPMDAYLQTGDGKIRLMGVYDGPVTTSVRGVASDFAELATAKDPAAALINGKIELKGDSAPLIELQKIITGLEIDWEAPLVEALGDVAGHQVARPLAAAGDEPVAQARRDDAHGMRTEKQHQAENEHPHDFHPSNDVADGPGRD